MTESKFNAVAILDAIPVGELNTARSLKEDLLDISNYKVDGLQVYYFRIETMGTLEAAISVIMSEIENNGLIPWLHLEGHGLSDESGFLLAGGTSCSWLKLKELITPLNVRLNLNLILILATCFGGSFARAIYTIDRAPVLGLIGPMREIKIGEIKDGFLNFYKTFFESYSLKKALVALESCTLKNTYYRTTAERFFYAVWSNYKTIHCTEQKIKERAQQIYQKVKMSSPSQAESVEKFEKLIREQESTSFEKYRDTYFMYDLDNSNRNRFPITYEKAEKFASSK